MATIFITGCNSYLAKNLIPQLIKSGHLVKGIDVTPSSSDEFIEADLCQPETYLSILKSCDIVIHLAAISSDPKCSNDPQRAMEVNVIGLTTLLIAISQCNVHQILFASTEWIYTDFYPGMPPEIDAQKLDGLYSTTKFIGENLLRSTRDFLNHVDIKILRLGIIYGRKTEDRSAVEAIAAHLIENDEIEVGSVLTGRHFIHIDDVVDAFTSALRNPGNCTLDVQGPSFVTIEQIIDILEVLLEKKIIVIEKASDSPSRREFLPDFPEFWKPKITISDGINKILADML